MGRGWRRLIPRIRATRSGLSALALVACLGLFPALSAGQIVVAIDAGHGGIDPGASSAGLVEKDIVLEFANCLAQHIERANGLRALMIRPDDRFLTLDERISRARAGGAHLLISLHADTTKTGNAEGAHVYTVSRDSTDEAAAALAERENRAEIIGGVALAGEPDDLATLLIDLARRGTEAEADKLASSVVQALSGQVQLLPTQPHRTANFRILKAADLPSLLVELGYMNHEADRARLVSDEWQNRMAAALTQGVLRWTERASPGFLTPKQ